MFFYKKKIKRIQEEKRTFYIKKEFQKFIENKLHIKSIILLVTLFAIFSVLSFSFIDLSKELKPGTPSSVDIYANHEFYYVDSFATFEKVKKAEENVFCVYDIDNRLFADVDEEIKTFFSYLSEEQLTPEKQDYVANFVGDFSVNVLKKYAQDANVIQSITNIAHKILKEGVIDEDEKYKLLDKGYINVRDQELKSEKKVFIDDLVTDRDLGRFIKNCTRECLKGNIQLRCAAEELLLSFIKPNLLRNNKEYDLRKIVVKTTTKPVYKKYIKGDAILRKGERITEDHLIIIKDMYSGNLIGSKIRYLAIFFIVFATMAFVVGYIWCFQKKVFASIKHLSILCIVIFLMSFLLEFFKLSDWEFFYAPVVMGSMLLTILINPIVGILGVIVLSMYVMIITHDVNLIIACVICGCISIFSVYKVFKRTDILKGGLIVGISGFFVVFALGLFSQTEFVQDSVKNGLMSCGIIFLSSIVVLGVLSLFEYFFKITTNIRLLEFSDINSPLLKMLADKAPGTYHHSLLVSRLAETAAKEIGGNSILARVGAYYHDIGKINKPEYFIENQLYEKGKHDKLSPNMSSLIIIAHVKDGYELAKKYNLGEEILNIIVEHHGSGLIYFFYKKAVEHSKGEEIIEEKFRYPGPKPQSKESAIVMLADSIEAASRALDDPTPSRLKGLIRRVINDKFIDEQLEECELTLQDLGKIENSFHKVLTSVFHVRIDYQKGNEDEKKDRSH